MKSLSLFIFIYGSKSNIGGIVSATLIAAAFHSSREFLDQGKFGILSNILFIHIYGMFYKPSNNLFWKETINIVTNEIVQ